MAGRKDKNTVDYFPHYCISGKTMYIIENKFGNDGYAVWFKILEYLGAANNHYIDCRNIADWEFLTAKMKVSENLLVDILNTLANIDAIDKLLWENKIIYSINFVKNISDAYKRRNNELMLYDDLCKHLLNLCEHKSDLSMNNDDINTQTKVNRNNTKSYKNILLSEIKISDFPDLNKRYFDIAVKFQHLIRNNIIESGAKPVHIDKTKGEAVDTIRLLIENDKYSVEDIAAVYQFLPKSEFWRKNILSIGKVREKFDKLIIAAKSELNGKEVESEKLIYKGNIMA